MPEFAFASPSNIAHASLPQKSGLFTLKDKLSDQNSTRNDFNTHLKKVDQKQRKSLADESKRTKQEVKPAQNSFNQKKATKPPAKEISSQQEKMSKDIKIKERPPGDETEIKETEKESKNNGVYPYKPLLAASLIEQENRAETKEVHNENSYKKNNQQNPLLQGKESILAASAKLSLSFNQHQTSTISGQAVQHTDAILNNLQRIIDASNEVGTVSITITHGKIQDFANVKSQEQLAFARAQVFQEEVIAKPTEQSQSIQLFRILEEDNPSNPPISTQLIKQQKNSQFLQLVSQELQAGRTGDKGVQLTTEQPLQDKNGAKHQSQQAENTKTDLLTERKDQIRAQIKTGVPEKPPETRLGESLSDKHPSLLKVNTSTEGNLFSSDSEAGNFLGSSSKSDQPEALGARSSSAQTITLPSGIVIRENEVVRQFIDKFQINSRNLESKINIKLNPAELGEIRIQLTVKEGSVNAIVVAQSQITAGILEKNLNRLRTVLQNQGFTIGDIHIDAHDETAAEFNLFEENFSVQPKDMITENRQTTIFSHQNHTEQEKEQDDSRVNLTV